MSLHKNCKSTQSYARFIKMFKHQLYFTRNMMYTGAQYRCLSHLGSAPPPGCPGGWDGCALILVRLKPRLLCSRLRYMATETWGSHTPTYCNHKTTAWTFHERLPCQSELGLCRYIDKPIYTGFLQYDTVQLSVSRRIATKGSNSNLNFEK